MEARIRGLGGASVAARIKGLGGASVAACGATLHNLCYYAVWDAELLSSVHVHQEAPAFIQVWGVEWSVCKQDDHMRRSILVITLSLGVWLLSTLRRVGPCQ